MTGARKIPSHLERELRRHIKPVVSNKSSPSPSFLWRSGSKSGSSSSSSSSSSQQENKKFYTLLGCTAFVGITASFPYLGAIWIGPLSESDEALTHAQIRRGAFNNSGSRDVGKDPYWDFKTGTRIKDKSYEELFLKDNPNEMDHGDQYSRAYNVKRTKE